MKFAFVFPGQGSQSIGMMSNYGESPVIRSTFDEASEVLGEDLWKIASEGPADALAKTVVTQPLMLTAGVAVFRLWCESGGPTPYILAGHSLGEYAALVASRALDFADALPLVRLRALAMQEAVPQGAGAMAALLGIDQDAVRMVCEEAAGSEIVACANLNDPGQMVISGHAKAVSRAIELAKARGAKRAIFLPVSAPFHCALMGPAAERLKVALDAIEIRSPEVPVVSNVDVETYSDCAQIRDALVRQAYSPVRWIETVQFFAKRHCDHVVECGPGKVLVKLTRRICHDLESHSLHDASSLNETLAILGGDGK